MAKLDIECCPICCAPVKAIVTCNSVRFEYDGPRWISVEERLPEELQYVLAINQYDDDSFEPCIAYFSAGQWFHGSYMGGDITYWMPLPSAPKEE